MRDVLLDAIVREESNAQSEKPPDYFWHPAQSHLQRPLERDVITRETSMVELRKQFEEGAKKLGAMPPDILATPVGVPDLPEGLSAEWIRLTANAASLCWHPCFRRPLRPGMRQLRTSRNA